MYGVSGEGDNLEISEGSSDLFHSAQGSFGHSGSVFSSNLQMDRSVARSKMQRPPLAEEDEHDRVESSDADSFFSASDDDHHADDDCRSVTHVPVCFAAAALQPVVTSDTRVPPARPSQTTVQEACSLQFKHINTQHPRVMSTTRLVVTIGSRKL